MYTKLHFLCVLHRYYTNHVTNTERCMTKRTERKITYHDLLINTASPRWLGRSDKAKQS